MRFGALEFGIIVVIILIIFVVTRMLRIGQKASEQNTAPVTGKGTEEIEEEIKQFRRSRFLILGIIAILVGILILLSSLSLMKWIVWGPIGAFILVAIGLATIFIARRR